MASATAAGCMGGLGPARPADPLTRSIRSVLRSFGVAQAFGQSQECTEKLSRRLVTAIAWNDLAEVDRAAGANSLFVDDLGRAWRRPLAPHTDSTHSHTSGAFCTFWCVAVPAHRALAGWALHLDEHLVVAASAVLRSMVDADCDTHRPAAFVAESLALSVNAHAGPPASASLRAQHAS